MKRAYRKYIADKIKGFRKSAAYTQIHVADTLGIKVRTYQAYEEARAEPSLLLVEKICSLYNISVDNLLYDSPFRNTKNFRSQLV